MPNYSGVWTLSQQFQGRGQGLWPVAPGAPTIGTATGGNATASVAFTAPTCTGIPAGVTSYTVTSTPGCFTGTGASSPVTVSGLTNCTAYTFKVKAKNASGLFGPCSAASNSVTPSAAGSQSYTTAGTYTWVAPSGVTSVSVVTIGGGSNGQSNGGGGGGLGYKNNITVTPGGSYTVQVAPRGVISCQTYFINVCTVYGGHGLPNSGGNYFGTGGGNGGASSGFTGSGGGGAGGYGSAGGNGGSQGATGQGSTYGGGGGGSGSWYVCCCVGTVRIGGGGGGGGVGLYGRGTGGGGGTGGGYCVVPAAGGGGGGGGSSGASGTNGTGNNTTGGNGGTGGAYGGGGGGYGYSNIGCSGTPGNGSGGAVRIVWPGNTRQFPSTCVGLP